MAGLRTPCPVGHFHIEIPVRGWKGVRENALVFEFGTLLSKIGWID